MEENVKTKILIFFFFSLLLFALARSVSIYGTHSIAQNDKPEMHIFIHVCTINHWRDVLDEQIQRIEDAGLYEACNTISLGVLGEGDITSFQEKYPKLTILFHVPKTDFYERPTLLHLHELCVSHPNAFVLYLHSKGVSKKPPNKNVADWNNLMEHFLIDRWRDCIQALQSYDICGVNWRSRPSPHFSGNFWWARADYIFNLPGSIDKGYYDPEFWIGKMSPKVRCFHQSKINHYKKPYPQAKYIKPN
jgi:hypothetical protein